MNYLGPIIPHGRLQVALYITENNYLLRNWDKQNRAMIFPLPWQRTTKVFNGPCRHLNAAKKRVLPHHEACGGFSIFQVLEKAEQKARRYEHNLWLTSLVHWGFESESGISFVLSLLRRSCYMICAPDAIYPHRRCQPMHYQPNRGKKPLRKCLRLLSCEWLLNNSKRVLAVFWALWY